MLHPYEKITMQALLVQNLDLLGYTKYQQENNLPELDPHQFNSPQHAKIAEHILYFLFTSLDPSEYVRPPPTRKFMIFQTLHWPIADRNQARDFRVSVFKYLEVLKKQHGAFTPECPLRKSFLDECRGERYFLIYPSQ